VASQADILKIVHAAIDDVNDQMDSNRIEKDPQAALYGPGGVLDSMGIISLIVAVEQHAQDDLGVSVTLASDQAMSAAQSPFRTVATLTEYVARLLEQGND